MREVLLATAAICLLAGVAVASITPGEPPDDPAHAEGGLFHLPTQLLQMSWVLHLRWRMTSGWQPCGARAAGLGAAGCWWTLPQSPRPPA